MNKQGTKQNRLGFLVDSWPKILTTYSLLLIQLNWASLGLHLKAPWALLAKPNEVVGWLLNPFESSWAS